LIDSLGTIRAADGSSLTVVRSLLKVFLKRDATQRERQQAMDLVGGTVVGGFRIGGANRDYFVRIHGPSIEDIQAAIRKLDALAQAAGAFPFFVNVRICCGEAATVQSTR
jgi:fructosamine-3-kinase